MASKTNPIAFLKQVRSETAKVTWPSRRETMISTVMVFVMVILAAVFFFAADHDIVRNPNPQRRKQVFLRKGKRALPGCPRENA